MASLAVSGQNVCTFIIYTDAQPQEMHYLAIENSTGDTLMNVFGFTPNVVTSWMGSMPNGQVTFKVTDSAGNGFTNGFAGMVHNNSMLWHVSGNFGFQHTAVTTFNYYNPCSYCRTDINSNGITDVDDLLIFISEFGNTCE